MGKCGVAETIVAQIILTSSNNKLIATNTEHSVLDIESGNYIITERIAIKIGSSPYIRRKTKDFLGRCSFAKRPAQKSKAKAKRKAEKALILPTLALYDDAPFEVISSGLLADVERLDFYSYVYSSHETPLAVPTAPALRKLCLIDTDAARIDCAANGQLTGMWFMGNAEPPDILALLEYVRKYPNIERLEIDGWNGCHLREIVSLSQFVAGATIKLHHQLGHTFWLKKAEYIRADIMMSRTAPLSDIIASVFGGVNDYLELCIMADIRCATRLSVLWVQLISCRIRGILRVLSLVNFDEDLVQFLFHRHEEMVEYLAYLVSLSITMRLRYSDEIGEVNETARRIRALQWPGEWQKIGLIIFNASVSYRKYVKTLFVQNKVTYNIYFVEKLISASSPSP